MELQSEHFKFEHHLNQIRNLNIKRVEYAEIAYDKAKPQPYYKTQFENIDTVDFSVFLFTNCNKVVEIFWDDKFFQYGIGLKVNEKSDFNKFQTWDVSKDKLWSKSIGHNITDTKVYWEVVTTDCDNMEKAKKIIYPQAIKITFAGGYDIIISASSFLNKGDIEVFGMSDNLIICNNELIAKQVKMIG